MTAAIGSGHYNGHHEPVVFRTPPVRLLAISPGGEFVAAVRQVSRSGALFQLWNVAGNQLLFEQHEPRGITAIAFDPSGTSLAYGSGDRSLVFQSLPAGRAVRWGAHRLPIGALAFSPDAGRLASFGNDGRVLVWTSQRERCWPKLSR